MNSPQKFVLSEMMQELRKDRCPFLANKIWCRLLYAGFFYEDQIELYRKHNGLDLRTAQEEYEEIMQEAECI